MNTMHNTFGTPGGYSGPYPGYVPAPSLSYYNTYPGDLPQPPSSFYGKQSSVQPGYSSGVGTYSAPVSNSSVYYPQYGLGYQYGYNKYGLGSGLCYSSDLSSGPSMSAPSVGGLQAPTTDLGLTGSMFSKGPAKYSGSPGSSSPINPNVGISRCSPSVLSPSSSNPPHSPVAHSHPVSVRGGTSGNISSPPVENNESQKDLDKMRCCNVCGQVFRLMSECLAHVKAVHEAPLNFYNFHHAAGGHPSQPVTSVPPSLPVNTLSRLSSPAGRNVGQSASDSPLVALERMGWNEKQGLVPSLQSTSLSSAQPTNLASVSAPQVPVSQNHVQSIPSSHSINTQHSLCQSHTIHGTEGAGRSSPAPANFTGSVNAGPVSQSAPSLNVLPVHDILTKPRKQTSYSVSSIIGETDSTQDTATSLEICRVSSQTTLGRQAENSLEVQDQLNSADVKVKNYSLENQCPGEEKACHNFTKYSLADTNELESKHQESECNNSSAPNCSQKCSSIDDKPIELRLNNENLQNVDALPNSSPKVNETAIDCHLDTSVDEKLDKSRMIVGSDSTENGDAGFVGNFNEKTIIESVQENTTTRICPMESQLSPRLQAMSAPSEQNLNAVHEKAQPDSVSESVAKSDDKPNQPIMHNTPSQTNPDWKKQQSPGVTLFNAHCQNSNNQSFVNQKQPPNFVGWPVGTGHKYSGNQYPFPSGSNQGMASGVIQQTNSVKNLCYSPVHCNYGSQYPSHPPFPSSHDSPPRGPQGCSNWYIRKADGKPGWNSWPNQTNYSGSYSQQSYTYNYQNANAMPQAHLGLPFSRKVMYQFPSSSQQPVMMQQHPSHPAQNDPAHQFHDHASDQLISQKTESQGVNTEEQSVKQQTTSDASINKSDGADGKINEFEVSEDKEQGLVQNLSYKHCHSEELNECSQHSTDQVPSDEQNSIDLTCHEQLDKDEMINSPSEVQEKEYPPPNMISQIQEISNSDKLPAMKKPYKIGPKSKVYPRPVKEIDEADDTKVTVPGQESMSNDDCHTLSPYGNNKSYSSGNSSDSDGLSGDDEPKFVQLKPVKRRLNGGLRDRVFIGPKRVKIARIIRERQVRRERRLKEQMKISELEEQLQAQRALKASEEESPFGNMLLQTSIILSDNNVERCESVKQHIASLEAEHQTSNMSFFPNSCGEIAVDRYPSSAANQLNGKKIVKKGSGNKVFHNENSVIVKDNVSFRPLRKLRAKDFKWSHYIKSVRYWCADCAHGFRNNKEVCHHTEDQCKLNCLYMLECYIIVKDIQSHPQYGTKVQELLEEYLVDGEHTCKTCGEVIPRKADYLVHVDSHKDFMPWECTICGTRFRIRGSLKEHLRYTHMKGRVPCLKCNKVFPTSTLLRQHVKNCETFAC